MDAVVSEWKDLSLNVECPNCHENVSDAFLQHASVLALGEAIAAKDATRVTKSASALADVSTECTNNKCAKMVGVELQLHTDMGRLMNAIDKL